MKHVALVIGELILTKILKWIAGRWLLATLIVIFAGLLSRPQQADLAIVYGNKVHADGSPSSRLAARLDEARLCYGKGLWLVKRRSAFQSRTI